MHHHHHTPVTAKEASLEAGAAMAELLDYSAAKEELLDLLEKDET